MRKTRDTGPTPSLRPWLPVLLALALGACGSDDDNDGPSSSSASSSSVSYSGGIENAGNSGGISDAQWPAINLDSREPKRLHFSWTPVEGADHYRLWKNADGNSGYELVSDNLTAPEATDTIAVHRHDWDDALYQVTACMDADCNETENSEELVTLAAMLDTMGFVKASNTDAGDWFGWSLTLSNDGKTLAVGASREASQAQGVNGDESDNSVFGAGAAYVFTLEDGLWQQEAYLKASNTEAPATNDDGEDITRTNDRFGYRVELSGNGTVLAVSAAFEDGNGTGINPEEDNNAGFQTGAVYLFKRGESGWSQDALIKASNADPADENEEGEEPTEEEATEEEEEEESISIPSNAGDTFGHRLALSEDGTTLSVSALYESSSDTGINGDESLNDAPSAGAVYVFNDGEEGWAQQAYIKPSNTRAGQLFGSSLGISADGNTLAVSAEGEDSAATGIDGDDNNLDASNTGAVYIFTRDEGQWAQATYIKPSHTYEEALIRAGFVQRFGHNLGLSADGKTLAVASLGDASGGTGVDASPNDYDLEDADTFAPNSGAVYLFEQDDNGWNQTAYLKASNSRRNLRFGQTLSLSANGDHLAVGALREASAETGVNGDATDTSVTQAGAVYYFVREGDGWRESTYVKSPTTEEYDNFGQSLDLSLDGNTLAIGSHRDDSDATGINGGRHNNDARDSGAVFLY
ncbi:FG-GAP repeat protein [Marinimicrobium locisalis]|uniref:FG-GAP repeat protein n=1 Tax=Marinimicrobium locisalis TaxID=546022 RepID=UPI00322175BF